MPRSHLSRAETRRIVLAAQGFDRERPASNPDARHLRRVMNTLGLLQLDYVNVLLPAHFLVLWSRLGAYDQARFERLVYRQREFTEQWAHEASIVPASSWPLLEHRRRSHRLHKSNPLRRIRNRSAYLDQVLRQVQQDGALTASDLPPVPGPRRNPGDWHRSIPRWALEFHFARGDLAIAGRLKNFQRVYDVSERVVPDKYRSLSMSKNDAQRELLRTAATAMGIATLRDLADYFRMSAKEAAPLLAELVEQGGVSIVSVEGWGEPAYLSATARLPREIRGASLLSPFDPLVWFRPRAERVFDFHYRIEIYVPAAQRRWGYYVLPFRVGDQIVARVDLKADRAGRRLRVLRVHEEQGADRNACTDRLASELRELAHWLGLENVHVTRHNAISRQLAKLA